MIFFAMALTAGHGAYADTAKQPHSLWTSLAQSSQMIGSLPVTTLDARPVDMGGMPGWKVIYFWSAECPCVKACEHYSLVPLAEKYAGKVSFYAVDADGFDLSKPAAELSKEAEAHKLPYEVVLDRTHATTKALGAEVTPECFLLDPENRIVYSGMPDDSKRYLLSTGKRGVTDSYLAKAIAQALAGKPISTPHTELQGCIIAW